MRQEGLERKRVWGTNSGKIAWTEGYRRRTKFVCHDRDPSICHFLFTWIDGNIEVLSIINLMFFQLRWFFLPFHAPTSIWLKCVSYCCHLHVCLVHSSSARRQTALKQMSKLCVRVNNPSSRRFFFRVGRNFTRIKLRSTLATSYKSDVTHSISCYARKILIVVCPAKLCRYRDKSTV